MEGVNKMNQNNNQNMPQQQPVQPQPNVAQNNVPPIQPNNNMYYGQNNMNNNVQNPKKSNTGLVIGILVAIVVIVLIVIFVGKNKGDKPNNKNSNGTNSTSQLNSNTPSSSSSDGNITFDSSNKKVYSNVYETGSSTTTGLVIINISDNGEANLLSSLSNLYGDKKSVDEIKKCTAKKQRGAELFLENYKLNNSGREYNVVYSCNFKNGMKALLANYSVVDGAVIVVSAKKGVIDEYAILLSTLNKIGVSKVIVYVNNDDNSKQSSTVNSIKSLVANYGYDKNTPVIVGKNDTDSAKKFMTELEKWIGKPKADSEKPFLMPVEEVMTISGRGTVVTGRVEKGSIKVNEAVEIIGLKDTKKTSVTGIEMFRKTLDSATVGDNAGVLVKDLTRNEIERGQVLAKPGTITAHTKFRVLVYFLTNEEGGRRTAFTGQTKPQFYFRTTDITGAVQFPSNIKQVNPGDIAEFTVTLNKKCAMLRGDTFAIREGGKTTALGKVIELLD